MMKRFLGQMSDTVRELLLGILLFGAAIWLVLIWFVPDKGSFTIGLLLGTLLAVVLGLHMNYSIGQSLEFTEKDAKSYMQKMAVLRMGMIVVVFGAAHLLRIGSPLAIFAGLFTLKFGAYFQPVLHRLIHKKEKERR